MKHPLALALALLLPLALGACDGDDGTGLEDDAELGTFTATITGDLDKSLEGAAWFGQATDPDTDEVGWVLWLSTTESTTTGETIYFVRRGTRPGTGTHTLVEIQSTEPDVGDIVAGYVESMVSSGSFTSTGGSLSLTRSDDDRMAGTFTIQATGISNSGSEPTEATITITGSFSALGATVTHPGT